MGRLSDQPDGWAMKRVFSPDRRLALDYLPHPDPRSQYELDNPEAVELRDAETGARLAEFSGWFWPESYSWPEGGGIEMKLGRGGTLRVASDLATFTAGDPPVSRPIGALPEWLRSLIPPPPPLPPDPTPLARLLTIGAFALVLGAGGYAISRLPAFNRGDGPARYDSHQITGWVVTCPGIGWTHMHIMKDGRLYVPRTIAPEPLPPIEGAEGEARRFGHARVMVEVEGTAATLWPEGPGGRALSCAPRAQESQVSGRGMGPAD